MKPFRPHRRHIWIGPVWLLLAAWVAIPAAVAETLERSLAVPELRTLDDPAGPWVRLDFEGALVDVPFGAPAVPCMQVTLPLPPGVGVQGVRWEVVEQQTFALPRALAPHAGDQALTQPEVPTASPDPSIYGRAELYPPEDVRLARVIELTNGARYAVVRVFPVHFRPVRNEVVWTRQGRLTLTLGDGAAPARGLAPERKSLPLAGPLPTAVPDAGQVLLAEHGFAPSEVPSVEGSPIVYAIVCPPEPGMAAAWQAFADWKTACGYPAAVFRTDWIDQNYPGGADQPERIRNFLRDAYTHWGLAWVLIGGDAALIPARYARSYAYGPAGVGTEIASDYYYACLEGNWDADADGIYGESTQGGDGDFADLLPDIHVGRVSARSAAEVNDFLEKYFTYARTPAMDGYLDRVLLLGEVLFHAEWSRTARSGSFDCMEEECVDAGCRKDNQSPPRTICVTQDGAVDAVEIGDLLGGTLGLQAERIHLLERVERWREQRPDIDPAPELESAASVLSRLSAGCNFVHHVGHGDRDRWAVGEGRIEIGQLNGLTNGNADHYFWAYGVNCNSAAVDFDSFGERLVMMPDQGAVGYIGCTNADFPSTARIFANDFYSFLFGSAGATLGDGHFSAMAAHAPSGQQINNESIYRFLIYTQIVLGDPGMRVWRRTPSSLAVQLPGLASSQVPMGTTTLTVSVTSGGSAVEGARVCVQKAGELYVVAITGTDGRVAVPFWPETLGAFTVTATAPDCLESTLAGTVVSATSGPALVLTSLQIGDDGTGGSAGNGNGRIEVGETVRLALTVGNAGVGPASNVTGTLALGAGAPEGCVAVSDGAATLGEIAAGGSASDASAFLLIWAPDPPEEAFAGADLIRVPFRLTLSSGGGAAAIDLHLELSRPRIEAMVNRLIDSGTPNVKKLWLGIANRGQGTASNLLGRLVSLDAYKIQVQTPSASSDDVAPGDTALVGPFRVRITNDLGRIVFTLLDTSTDPDDTLHTRNLDLRGPAAPDSLQLVGLPESMGLTWKAAVDAGGDPVLGYRVYRDLAGQSPPFPEVVGDVLKGHHYFTDMGLGVMSRYSYYVAAVDAGGNLGVSSPVSSAYTSPGLSTGWPHYVTTFTKASPMVCELDGWTSAGREVLFGADCVYGFHGDGREVIDGDFLERSTGPFGVVGPGNVAYPFWARPAAADIDGDGSVEVVAISMVKTKDNPDPNARGQLFCWNNFGRNPKWVFTFSELYASWNAPVLADLNNDGKLEIIFCGGRVDHAGVYVLNSDGTPWVSSSPTGLLRDLGARDLYVSPAVGDVDGDGQPEIVVATRCSSEANGALWVLRPNGTDLPGFGGGVKFSNTPRYALAQMTTSSPSLCDVDGVAGDEIFVITQRRLWCFGKRGADPLWVHEFSDTWNLQVRELTPEPAIGDVDGDGKMDIAVVDAGGKLRVVQCSTGNLVTSKQLPTGIFYGSCILANVDADGGPEIIFGDNKGRIHAYRFDGEIAAGFPIHFGGEFHRGSLAAWDVDLNGYQNLVAQANQVQKLAVFDLEGARFPRTDAEIRQQCPWPMRGRDARNTCRLTTSTPVVMRVEMDGPQVSPAGEVTLTWSTSEAVAAFRIRRSAGEAGPEQVIGEVPAASGGGERHYAFTDVPPEPGSYRYRVNPVLLDGDESEGPLVEVAVGGTAPVRFGVQRVSPNPLVPGRVASVTLGLPGAASSPVDARLAVYDVQGRRVRTLIREARPAGVHVVAWDGRDDGGRAVPAGLYVLRLESRGAHSEQRVLLLR
jgi:hypothetical protein